MDTHNFWYWLIEGVSNLIGVFTGRLPLYAPVGLGPFIYNFLVAAVTPILFYFGSFFNLCWFMAFLALFAASETARAAFAAWRTIVKIIPLP